MFTLDPSSENVLSILGAMFDIVGAVFLASAAVVVDAKSMMRQATSGYGGVSTPLVKLFSDQWVEGLFGLILLLIGFAMQGTAGYGVKTASNVVFAVGALALTGAVLLYFVARRFLTEWRFKGACRTLSKADGSPAWTEDEINDMWKREQNV